MQDYALAELRAERERSTRLNNELVELRARQQADPDNAGIGERLHNLTAAIRASNERTGELQDDLNRYDRLERTARDQRTHESGDGQERYGIGPHERRGHAFNEAQRQLEDHVRNAELSSEAADRLDVHLRDRDPAGVDAQYLAAVAQPCYGRAWQKLLQFGEGGAMMRMTSEEQDAMQQVVLAEQQRTMIEGTPGSGGYALPITIDPTLNLVSQGAINPIRKLATVRTISTRELRLLATDGVTASYAAEMTEASDNSPALSQPDIFVERAQSFVPLSFELFDDWATLQTQLSDLFADAKDVLEAQKFLTGAGHGSSEPQGILTGLAVGQQVKTAGTAAVSTADVYAIKSAVPFRFQPTTTFVASPAMVDRLYRLVPRASTTDPTLVSDDRQQMLGYPLTEYSAMTAAITTGSNIVVAGDFKKGYVIADRIGMAIELIPHLFGTVRNYPVGARGLYCRWRNSAAVIASSDSAPLVYLQTA